MNSINPRKLLAVLCGLTLLSCVFANAQSENPFQISPTNEDLTGITVSSSSLDSVDVTDKVHLKKGNMLVGKVTLIKVDVVEFVEQETNLKYELSKAEIKVIILSSGKTLSFADEAVPAQQSASSPTPIVIEKESGPSAALVILAAIGGTLILLLLIGAAAQ